MNHYTHLMETSPYNFKKKNSIDIDSQQNIFLKPKTLDSWIVLASQIKVKLRLGCVITLYGDDHTFTNLK